MHFSCRAGRPKRRRLQFRRDIRGCPMDDHPSALVAGKPVTSGHLIVQRYLPTFRRPIRPWPSGILRGCWLLGSSSGSSALGGRHVLFGNGIDAGREVVMRACTCSTAFCIRFHPRGDPSRTIWFLVIGTTMTAFAFEVAASSRRRTIWCLLVRHGHHHPLEQGDVPVDISHSDLECMFAVPHQTGVHGKRYPTLVGAPT